MSHADDDNHAHHTVSSVWQTTLSALTRRLQYRRMLKPLVLLLGVFTTGTWLVVVTMSREWGAAVTSNLLADEGPGELWIPPDEHPVPLSKFPDFTGLGSMSRRERDEARAREAHEGRDDDRPEVTLLFMHVWKCAGSSMRHMLRDWAELEGQSIGIVVRCSEIYKDGHICLQDHELINARVQGAYIRRNQVLAGHFTWGFQYHVRQPYVMFTTLRDPLELFVSGQQYLNRKAAKRFSNAVEVAASTMRVAIVRYKALYGGPGGAGTGDEELDVPEIQGGKAVGFIYRLVTPEVISNKTLDEAAEQAINNLDTFWLVGVVEQYRGFMVVLREMMDPLRRHKELWKAYEVGKFNKSPNGAGRVLAGIDAVYPGLMREFNETLRHQWMVYQHAKNLFSDRCREILHTRDHGLCDVPSVKSEYTMVDLDKEVLFQELQAGSLNGSEGLRPSGGD